MMENSIDAGATNVDILVKDGGIKMLQISDNGCGIMKDDLPILCERFTTSKLKSFEDLSRIQTYGFRGEALASISHIARLHVVTKTKENQCAWKAVYENGVMVGEPKPTAGKDGTTILVQDLFYNVPSRLRALRSPSEEFAKIVDVVGKYAIHSDGVGFSCKKFGETQYALNVRGTSSKSDKIRAVFGAPVVANLVEVDISADPEHGLTSSSGQITTPDFNNKKSIPAVFFINNRLVSCDPLRRALSQVYSNFLPKGNKPFIYMSLHITPENVDVNVHPTKREVRFLYEEELIERIGNLLHERLSQLDTSRTFKPGSLTPGKHSSTVSSAFRQSATPASTQPKAKRAENMLVRTDGSQAKITNYVRASQSSTSSSFSTSLRKKSHAAASDELGSIGEDSQDTATSMTTSTQEPNHTKSRAILTLLNNEYEVVQRERTEVNLTSIKTLKQEVDEDMHKELTSVFADMTYVGVVDATRRLASIQHGLKLFLVDYGSLCNELFYQIGLTDFANFGKIYIQDEVENREGLAIYQLLSKIDNASQSNILEITQQLWDMREMLENYYSIEICGDETDLTNVRIKSVPLLLKDYVPPLSKLPFFLYRMGTKVDWSSEKECLEGILRQLALFYIPEIIEHVDINDDTIDGDVRAYYISKAEHIGTVLEQVVFPTIKRRLLASTRLLKDIVEVANLPGLYKVFERC